MGSLSTEHKVLYEPKHIIAMYYVGNVEKSILSLYDESGEPARRLILGELRSGPKCVGDLVENTKLKQPNVSNHLSRLKAKKIVRSHKVGRHVYYSLSNPDVEHAVQSVLSVPIREFANVDLHALCSSYAHAAIEGKELKCTEVLENAFRIEAPLIDIYSQILEPAMRLIGTWYTDGKVSIAQEHLASAITERMMAKAANLFPPARSVGKSAVLGCAANSWHTLGLRMVSDLLKLRGWNNYFLGANVPTQSFCNTVLDSKPAIVMISCASEESETVTLELLGELVSLQHGGANFKIIMGGFWVSTHPDRFLIAGADICANNLHEVDALLTQEVATSS